MARGPANENNDLGPDSVVDSDQPTRRRLRPVAIPSDCAFSSDAFATADVVLAARAPFTLVPAPPHAIARSI